MIKHMTLLILIFFQKCLQKVENVLVYWLLISTLQNSFPPITCNVWYYTYQYVVVYILQTWQYRFFTSRAQSDTRAEHSLHSLQSSLVLVSNYITNNNDITISGYITMYVATNFSVFTFFIDCSRSQSSKITEISCLTLCVMSSIQSLTNGSNHSENVPHFNSPLKVIW